MLFPSGNKPQVKSRKCDASIIVRIYLEILCLHCGCIMLIMLGTRPCYLDERCRTVVYITLSIAEVEDESNNRKEGHHNHRHHHAHNGRKSRMGKLEKLLLYSVISFCQAFCHTVSFLSLSAADMMWGVQLSCY